MFRIYPYRKGSKSVRALKESINAKIIKLDNTRYRQRDTHTVINWGNSRTPDWLTGSIINKPEAVRLAANKLEAFKSLMYADVSVPLFSSDKRDAEAWLNEGYKVFARQTLTGHSGEGIVVVEQERNDVALNIHRQLLDAQLFVAARALESEMEDEERPELPDAPMYTRGVQNHGEYRVHVFKDDIILYQKKSRRVDEDGNVITAEGEAADVRNLASNWVYRTGNLRRLERIEDIARRAISALGLEFGAVDIIMDGNGDVHVLEINTAPGLGNTQTLEAYANAFNNM